MPFFDIRLWARIIISFSILQANLNLANTVEIHIVWINIIYAHMLEAISACLLISACHKYSIVFNALSAQRAENLSKICGINWVGWK